MKPIRLQMKRKKGFNLQKESKKINGLPCILVSRPTKWGNPYDWREYGREQAVQMFEQDINKKGIIDVFYYLLIKKELKGKNLSCWCPLKDKFGKIVPCHATILLQIASE